MELSRFNFFRAFDRFLLLLLKSFQFLLNFWSVLSKNVFKFFPTVIMVLILILRIVDSKLLLIWINILNFSLLNIIHLDKQFKVQPFLTKNSAQWDNLFESIGSKSTKKDWHNLFRLQKCVISLSFAMRMFRISTFGTVTCF